MRTRALLVAAVLAAAAVAVVVVLVTRGGGEPSGPVVLRVDAAHPGRAVPSSFLGLSVEYASVPAYLRDDGVLALLRRLGDAQGSPVALRIGGNSSDESWWNPAGRPRPHGVLLDLDERWARALASGRRTLGGPLALGLNLALDDPGNAVALVRAVRRAGVPRSAIGALELGNEPDLYPRGRTFRVGSLVVQRPQQRTTYDPPAFVREATAFARALAAGLGDPPLAAGGFATPGWVKTAVPGLLRTSGAQVRELLAHAYPLRDCNPDTDPATLRRQLLGDGAADVLRAAVAPYAGLGRPIRVAEFNSAVCGGVAGVSDSFAAALWAPGALFTFLSLGVRQADLHAWSGSFYAPFIPSPGGTAVRPLYSGLLLFARAAPAGSRLLPVDAANAGDVRAWATLGPDGVVRVLAVNRSEDAARELDIRAGARTADAQLLRAAGGLAARAGVSTTQRPVAVRAGRVTLDLPPASAALITAHR